MLITTKVSVIDFNGYDPISKITQEHFVNKNVSRPTFRHDDCDLPHSRDIHPDFGLVREVG